MIWWLKQLWLFAKELYFDVKFYHYEIWIPDYEQERKRGLEESYRRIRGIYE